LVPLLLPLHTSLHASLWFIFLIQAVVIESPYTASSPFCIHPVPFFPFLCFFLSFLCSFSVFGGGTSVHAVSPVLIRTSVNCHSLFLLKAVASSVEHDGLE